MRAALQVDDLQAHADDLASRVTKDPAFGCWIWAGDRDRDGYGMVWRGGRPVGAHLIVWTALRGPVPSGQVLDHLCRRRPCVRPDHLEPVTEAENARRRRWRARVRVATCAMGHDQRTHAMITPEGGRLCRLCHGPGVAP